VLTPLILPCNQEPEEEWLIKVESHIILGIKTNHHKVSEPAEQDLWDF
jgi:hypothetical protein